MAPISMNLSDL